VRAVGPYLNIKAGRREIHAIVPKRAKAPQSHCSRSTVAIRKTLRRNTFHRGRWLSELFESMEVEVALLAGALASFSMVEGLSESST